MPRRWGRSAPLTAYKPPPKKLRVRQYYFRGDVAVLEAKLAAIEAVALVGRAGRGWRATRDAGGSMRRPRWVFGDGYFIAPDVNLNKSGLI